MTFIKFMRWTLFGRIKKIRPYWLLQYSKEEARGFLQDKCGWTYYGGHHLENRLVAYSISTYLPTKFGLDYRNLVLSALCRQGKINRDEAMAEYARPPASDPELVEYFIRRLGLTCEEYESVMKKPPTFWWSYPTYKKRFEMLRPMFRILAKANIVPKSFYLKYCFPVNIPK